MKISHNPFIVGASLSAFAFTCTGAFAAPGVWDGTTGNFDVATNWEDDVVPGAINVVVDNGGTIQVTSNHTVNDILAGTTPGGKGTWEISAGELAMGGGWFRLGTNATGEGTVNVTGGVLTTGGEQNIGETTGGRGNVNVSGGIWNNNGAPLAAGGNSGANGGGIGTLKLSGTGVINNNNELWVGVGNTAEGTMTISGGTINQRNWTAVGRSGGTGTLNMTGGIFNKTADNGDATIIGSSGTGTFNQTGGEFNVANGDTWIGETNTGIWRMSGGTANLQNLIVGWENNGVGTITLQGAADGMTGTLANGGGNEVLTAKAVTLGRVATSAGTINLDGGTLAVNTVARGAGTGTFNFNGGTLKAAADSPAFVTGVTTLVKEGGAVIDSNGFAVTVDTALDHGGVAATDGGLTKNGGGTLSLNQANGYTGATVINGGVLALTATGSIDSTSGVSLGTSGTLDVAAKGGYSVNNLSGSGVVIGGLSVSTSLAIGNSEGAIDFSDSLSLDGSSSFEFELTGGSGTSDLANVSGNLTLNGGILNLFQLGTYTMGEKFTLFSYSGSLTGEFNARLDDTVFTDGGGMWQINYDDTTAGLNGGTQLSFVTITAVPEPSSAALLGLLGAGLLMRRRRNG